MPTPAAIARRRLLGAIAATPVALALPVMAAPNNPTIEASFEALWQELFALGDEVEDYRHWPMLVMFDRMSAIVYGRPPMDKSPTLADALRKGPPRAPANDPALTEAWGSLIQAHYAMNGPLTEAEFERLGAIWTEAQDRFLAIPVTSTRGVALRLRYLLAMSDGFYPDAAYRDQPPADWPEHHWRERELHRTILALEGLS